MKKRVFAGMLAAMMMVSMMVTTAFAADPNELEVRATTLDTNGLPDGYDDYLGGTIMPHGESKPSIRDVFDLTSERYEGHLDRCLTGLYTNYCFKPNSNKTLYVGWDIYAHGYLDHGPSPTWTFSVKLYDLTANKWAGSALDGPYKDISISNSHSDYAVFSDLNTTHKYCVLFSCDETQVSGDVWVGHSSK